jgi:hypothetical protein
MRYTRGYILRSRIAFVLRKVKISLGRQRLPVRFTEEQRYDIAAQVVRELKEYGDPWKLDEPVREPQLAPTRPPGAEVK